jgi:hypothetical protein
MSLHAIKQFDNKWVTTNASICNFLPLSIWISKILLPTHPNKDEFAAIMFSLPLGLYEIFALSSKLFQIMVLDVPVSGRAVQWWYLPSSVALKYNFTLGVGLFFESQRRLPVAVAYVGFSI